MAIVKHSNFTR